MKSDFLTKDFIVLGQVRKSWERYIREMEGSVILFSLSNSITGIDLISYPYEVTFGSISKKEFLGE